MARTRRKMMLNQWKRKKMIPLMMKILTWIYPVPLTIMVLVMTISMFMKEELERMIKKKRVLQEGRRVVLSKDKGLAREEPKKKRKISSRRRRRRQGIFIKEESSDDEVVDVTEAIHQTGGGQNVGPSYNGVNETEMMKQESGEMEGDLLKSGVNESETMEGEIGENETEQIEEEISKEEGDLLESIVNETENMEQKNNENDVDLLYSVANVTERMEEEISKEKGDITKAGINETEIMEVETSKKRGNLLKSTPKKPLHIEEEDRRGKRDDGSRFKKRELADRKRKKNLPSTSKSKVGCSTFCKECGHAVTHKINSDNVDTPASREKVNVGKDEANESNAAKKVVVSGKKVAAEANEFNHAKKATTRKPVPNAAVQVESFLRRRIYHSSTSIDEGMNESRVNNLSEKQSEDNKASKGRNEPNAGPVIDEPVTKISLNEERDDTPLNDLSEEKVSSQEDGSTWFAKTKPVPQKGDFFKVLADAILREENVPSEEHNQERAEPSSSLGGSPTPMKFRLEDEEPEVPEKSAGENMVEVPEKTADENMVEVPEKTADENMVEVPEKSADENIVEVPEKSADEDMVEVLEKSADANIVEVPEKSDENTVADMFTELECNFEYESMYAFDSNQAGNRTEKASSYGNSCGEGKHDVVRNELVGDVCRICHCIVNDIRQILPDFAKFASRISGKRYDEKKDFLVPEGLDASTIMKNPEDFYNSTDNTVWSLIPGVRESLYKHQQDGFEFLWKNLGGATDLDQLTCTQPIKEVGGCIISHAPGTGKTRLSIVFVQSYLRLFPDAKPVIIAPASMLLTWEEEFKKWNIEFPFHNICNPEFSGRESKDLLKLFTMSKSQDNNKVRWVKLFSWKKGNSILGISYNLYEKLAGEKVVANDESKNLKKILLELPKLVVLDEGHIPRNQKSSIWKTLLKLETEKRVILSGTPFQNNFYELFNTLHLVRPEIVEKEKAFAGMVSSRRRYSKRPRSNNENFIEDARTKEVDKAIEKIKEIMQPFVHVHKGSILRKSLPGLTDCVVLLNPLPLQKSLIEKLEFSENSFELGYKVALLSVHPTLVEHIWTSEHEKSGFNLDNIKQLRLDSAAGVKTRFLMDLIQSSRAMNEKVLIFSQYIQPLKLIMDQLESNFGWHDGKEILHMQGRQDQLQRHNIIGVFNNPVSKAKVLLAATKCCSEGINLVGASRVVLLDVVWNPSVERQAISRAYRLGQKKVVYTYHLITSGTNEGDKYCRQVEKDRLSELVFCSAPKDNDEPSVQTKTFGDRILEKMINDGGIKDMISKIIHTPKEANLNETFGSVAPA